MSPRKTELNIDPAILERWSPRAFAPVEISETDLLAILEAGRWAPSAFNYQPWSFVYARKGTPEFDKFISLLLPFNQSWAINSSAIVFAISKTTSVNPLTSEETPLYSHSLDTGAAWGFIMLQAVKNGWHTHGMTGIHFAEANAALNVPEQSRIEMAFAIGKIGDKGILPEALAEREAPAPRKALDEVVFEGVLPA